ncbi:MAG TPA: type II toxin-antitoxin system VapC family toxin, partial [Rhizomicrobium sp.]
RLSQAARTAIADGDNEVYISAVVAWELATKVRIGKWADARELAENFDVAIGRNNFQPLAISTIHARTAGFLSGRHRDPFDRMLAAQSRIEDMPLVTADPVFKAFGTKVIW